MKSVCCSGKNASWFCVPSPQPLPLHCPEPDGDDALDGVVARAPGVRLGIEEGQHPLLLVVLEQPPPGEHRGERAAREHDEEVAPLHLGEHDHGHGDGEGDQRRAEVRLLHHQRHRHHDERERPQQVDDAVLSLAHAGLVAGEPAREEHDDGQLDELAGLHLHAAHLQPAPGAEHLLACEGHSREQSQGGHVTGPGQRLQPAVVDEEHHRDGAQPHRHPLRLRQRHEDRRVLRRRGEVPDAQRADEDGAQDQRPVQVVELLLGHAA